MNHYTQVTAKDTIPGVTPNDFEELKDKLEGTGLSAELWNVKGKGKREKGDLYLYSEEFFDEEDFTNSGALPIIGRLLKAAKMKHVQLGMACYGSKAAKDSSGGAEFRIYADGHLTWAETRFPEYPPKKPKAQKVWVIKIFCRDDSFATVDGAYSTKAAAVKAMKRYADAEYAEENGTTFYDEDEMTLVCLTVN